MKLALKIGIPLAIILLVAWLARERFTTRVPVATARIDAAVDAVTGTVKVYANKDLNVKTEVLGRVAEVLVSQDDEVERDDILVRLESQDLQQTLTQRRIQREAAEARLSLPYISEIDVRNATEDLSRVRQQVEYGGASQADLERAERSLERAGTALKNEQIGRNEQAALLAAQVDQLEAQIERMNIRAPFGGKVVTRVVVLGDFLWAGNQVLRLVSKGRWAEITLSEEDFYGVAPGQKATVLLASYPGEALKAEVTSLQPTADPATKTRGVFILIDAPEDKLIPGLTGEAVLIKAERQGSVIIPRRALIGNRVYVVKGGEIEVREVQPGYLSLNKAEILKGVEAGEQVVLEGQSLLRDGQRVESYLGTDE